MLENVIFNEIFRSFQIADICHSNIMYGITASVNTTLRIYTKAHKAY
jgi:hypothetical protein